MRRADLERRLAALEGTLLRGLAQGVHAQADAAAGQNHERLPSQAGPNLDTSGAEKCNLTRVDDVWDEEQTSIHGHSHERLAGAFPPVSASLGPFPPNSATMGPFQHVQEVQEHVHGTLPGRYHKGEHGVDVPQWAAQGGPWQSKLSPAAFLGQFGDGEHEPWGSPGLVSRPQSRAAFVDALGPTLHQVALPSTCFAAHVLVMQRTCLLYKDHK